MASFGECPRWDARESSAILAVMASFAHFLPSIRRLPIRHRPIGPGSSIHDTILMDMLGDSTVTCNQRFAGTRQQDGVHDSWRPTLHANSTLAHARRLDP